MNEIRRLVTRERVSAVAAIPDADAIEAVAVRGWTVVAKKGEFTAGDECVYVEIDAALPLDDERFAFLAPRGTKTLGDGKRVHVLKTAVARRLFARPGVADRSVSRGHRRERVRGPRRPKHG